MILNRIARRKVSPAGMSLPSETTPRLPTCALSMEWQSSKKSDNDFDEELMFVPSTIDVLPIGAGPQETNEESRRWGGSVLGRRPNKKMEIDTILSDFKEMYFNDNSIYDENDFERHFMMPSVLFNLIFDIINGRGISIKRKDAAEKPGVHPKMRMICAMRILGYGMGYD